MKMKRTVSILLAALLGMMWLSATALSENEIDIVSLVSANSKDAVFDKHHSIRRLVVNGNDQEITYATAAYYFNESQGLFVNATDNWHYQDKDGKELVYYDWYAMSEEEGNRWKEHLEDLNPVLDSEDTLQEEIRSITTDGNGFRRIETLMNAETFKSVYEAEGYTLPESLEGCYAVMEYVVPEDNLEIRSIVEKLYSKEEQLLMQVESTIEYDVEEPEIVGLILKEAEMLHSGNFENGRNLTVVYQPQTEQEEIYTILMPKGSTAMIYTRNGYNLFLDPEKTVPFIDGTGSEDLVIYAFPGE